MTIWATEWHSKNNLDGERRYIIHEHLLPALFKTRRECRAFIIGKYGYIVDRPDLQEEPHGWHVPKAVKVKVEKVRSKEAR